MEDLAANPNDGSSLILYALLPSKCGNLRAHSILGDPGYTAVSPIAQFNSFTFAVSLVGIAQRRRANSQTLMTS